MLGQRPSLVLAEMGRMESVLAQQAVESTAFHSRLTGGHGDIALGIGQQLPEVGFLELFHDLLLGLAETACRLRFVRSGLDDLRRHVQRHNLVAFRQRHRPKDGVPQLADISGPEIVLQEQQSGAGNSADALPLAIGAFVQEKLRQRRDVACALP